MMWTRNGRRRGSCWDVGFGGPIRTGFNDRKTSVTLPNNPGGSTPGPVPPKFLKHFRIIHEFPCLSVSVSVEMGGL